MKKYNKNMVNEMADRMKKIYEYTFYQGVREEENEPQNDNNQDTMNNNMSMDSNAPMGDNNMPMDSNAPMGGDNNMSMDGNAPMGDDNNMSMDGSAPMGGNEINGANLAPNAGMDDNNMEQGMDMMGDNSFDTPQPGENDDVIDITDLTDSQDELNQQQTELDDKMSDVDSKLTTLMKIVDKFSDALEANDAKIKDLTKELVKRNPTDEETMNVRLHAGGNPFSEKPEEFWNNFKDINNHYNITSNNDAPQTYEIRKSDLQNVPNNILDDDYQSIPRTLREYFIR